MTALLAVHGLATSGVLAGPNGVVRLLAELGGFPPAVLRLVRDHHERLDGSGYPGALQAGDMDVGPACSPSARSTPRSG